MSAEILIGFGLNLLSACLQEIASRLYDRRAESQAELNEQRQRSKALETRLTESLSAAAHNLSIPGGALELLRVVLNDAVFVSAVVDAVITGSLTAGRFEALVLQRNSTLRDDPAVKALAGIVSQAFDAAIAADPELGLLVSLRRAAHLKHAVEGTGKGIELVHEGVIDLSVQTTRDHEQTRAEIRDLRVVVERLHPRLLEREDSSRLKQSLKKRFDSALSELKDGSADIAAREFRNLLSELDPAEEEEKKLIFRATSNLGVALHYLGDTAGACDAFDRAYAQNKESIRAIANKILALISHRDYSGANTLLDDALRLAPDDSDLITFKAQVIAELNDDASAVRFLEEHPIENENYFVVLSVYYNRAREAVQAAQAAQEALRINANSSSGMAVLADALASPIVFRKAEQKLPGYALSTRELEILKEAIALDKRAAEMLRRSGHRASLAQLSVNLSAYSAAAGDFEGAARAAEEALTILPRDPSALANLYMAQMHLDRFSAAAETAKMLFDLEDPVVATMRELDALMAQHDFPAVIRLYNERSQTLQTVADHPHAVCVLAAATFRTFDTARALEILGEAARRFSADPLVFLERGHIREQLNEFEQAEADLKAAVNVATGAYAFHAQQQLGLYYYRRSNWEQAVRHLAAGLEQPSLSPYYIEYLISLYQLGRYRECLASATGVIETGLFEETVWELAANCHLNFADLEAAEELLEELVRHSQALRHWLKLFQVSFRLHDANRARNVLERAFVRHPDSFEVVVNLSGVEFTAGNHRRAFELAVKAVELRPNEIAAHHAVVRSGLFSPDSEKFSSEEKKIIQRSIAFLTGHEGGGIKAVPVGEDLAEIMNIMRQHRETTDKAEELFSTTLLPMTFLSQVLGKSSFVIWSGLAAHERLHVRMATGSREEQETEREIAGTAREVVLDAAALFTLRMLGLLPVIPKVYRQIFVATAVFESLKREFDEVGTLKRPESVLGYQDGRLILADIPPEAHETKKAFLSEILAFLKSDAVTLCGIDPAAWDDQSIRKTVDAVGTEVGHSIAIATTRDVPLYSDDLGVRVLAKNEHRTRGFCTQAFLRAAASKKYLSDEEYHDATLSLFEHNYHFVSESTDTVMRALRKANFEVTPLTAKLFLRFSEAGVNRTDSAKITGEALPNIWLHPSQGTRAKWIASVSEKLACLPDFVEVAGALLRGLAVATVRNPSTFFGVCREIAAGGLLSSEQRRVWQLLRDGAARGVAVACTKLYPGDAKLLSEWHEHIRICELVP